MAARDLSVPFDVTRQAVASVIASAPGTRLLDLDPATKVAVIEVPDSQVQAVREALDQQFFVDPNAPLRY
ncbi:hypothetical protein [Paracraurococcus lichenis]|uniref:Uncharacterized protein n=1 Tax=Paracraurococcus lichenis TaxID=3064888 RepID=A0ABT9E864_9PROT|nr:hypothetical protein [Paracraurococcus sp. LOR1-02]MDO9712317.1 hypothetical protein [Paracraurococcus sp. LOR1-02]